MGREEAEAAKLIGAGQPEVGRGEVGVHGGFLGIVASGSRTCPGLVISLRPTEDKGGGTDTLTTAKPKHTL